MFFSRMLSRGSAPFEISKVHLHQYAQKIQTCSDRFDFVPLCCLVGFVPNSLLSRYRGMGFQPWTGWNSKFHPGTDNSPGLQTVVTKVTRNQDAIGTPLPDLSMGDATAASGRSDMLHNMPRPTVSANSWDLYCRRVHSHFPRPKRIRLVQNSPTPSPQA